MSRATRRQEQLTPLAALIEEKATIESELCARAQTVRSTYIVFASMLQQAVQRKTEDLVRWEESGRALESGGGGANDGGVGDEELEVSNSDESDGDEEAEGSSQHHARGDRGRDAGGQRASVIRETRQATAANKPTNTNERSTTNTETRSFWDLIRDNKLNLGDGPNGATLRVEIARDGDEDEDSNDPSDANTKASRVSASNKRTSHTTTDASNALKRKRASHPLSRTTDGSNDTASLAATAPPQQESGARVYLPHSTYLLSQERN